MAKSISIIKLPGLIDVHVHLREPGATHKEDFESGSKAAIAGGYTQILDMPNNVLPTITKRALSTKIKLAQKRIWCDVGFNFGATATSSRYFQKIYKKVFGLKIYMNQTTGPLFRASENSRLQTGDEQESAKRRKREPRPLGRGNLLVEKYKDRELIFKSWDSSLPIMVHAQEDTVLVAIKLAKKYKKSLHVCHITYDQIRHIEKARKDGLDITCEVTPHHLFLNKNDIRKLGPLGMMKPPLLVKRDQQKLWAKLDKIDMISTDHAPHTLREKYDQALPKFGVPGLETTLPLMLTAIAKGLLTTRRLIEMTSTNPRRIFKLPNQPDTFVLIDFSKTYKIGDQKLFTKCAWTPFANLEGRGEIKKVVVRGKTVFKSGQFLGKPSGRVFYPSLSTYQRTTASSRG